MRTAQKTFEKAKERAQASGQDFAKAVEEDTTTRAELARVTNTMSKRRTSSSSDSMDEINLVAQLEEVEREGKVQAIAKYCRLFILTLLVHRNSVQEVS